MAGEVTPNESSPSAGRGNEFQPTPEQVNAMRIQEQLVHQEAESFQGLLKKIRLLDKDKSSEAKENHERLLEMHYERMFSSALEHPLLVAQENLEYRNAYAAWVSRPGRDFIEGVLSTLRDEQFKIRQKRERGWNPSPEREAWIKRMHADFAWMGGNYRKQEGIGHLMKYYFSGPDAILNALYEQRLNPTATHFIFANQRSVPELDLTQQQKDKSHHIREVKADYNQVTDEGQFHVDVIKKEGIRETAVRMGSDRFHYSVAIAGLGQINWLEVDETDGSISQASLDKQDFKMKLTEEEVVVLRPLVEIGRTKFDGKDVPEEVLSWFTITDTHNNKNEYKAIMEALLLENARQRIKEARNLTGEEKTKVLDKISKDVRERADKLRNEILDLSLEEKLARAIVRGGLAEDLAKGFSLKLGWAFQHKDGKRQVEFSGIYSGMDTYTPGWPFHHDMVYDRRASKRSSLVPPTDGYFREYVAQFPPTRWPDFLWGPNGAVARDPNLRKAMCMLFGDTPEGQKFQNDNDLHLKPEYEAILKKLLWGWGTGWNSNSVKPFDYAGTGKESNQMFFALAIPREVGVLLFENSVKLEGHKDADRNNITLWEELTENGVVINDRGERVASGKPIDLSDVLWGDMKEDAWDRWHVDMNMIGRVIINLCDPLKEDFKKQFFESPDHLKELLKRLYLGLRDEVIKMDVDGKTVQVPGPLLWCCYASTLLAWYVAGDKKLVSRFFENSKKSYVSGEGSLDSWLKNELWMPGDIPDFDKFSDTLTLTTFFAGYQMYYMGGSTNGAGNEQETITRAKNITSYLPTEISLPKPGLNGVYPKK